MATWNGTGQGISGTSVVNQVPFPSDGEFCTLGVSYDSKSQLISWTYQGVLIQRAAFDDRLTGQKTTNAVETWAYPKGVLVPTLGVRTKEASANSMKVDYFRCGMRRRNRV